MNQLAIWALSALLSLPVYQEDRSLPEAKAQQYELIAQGVAEASAERPRSEKEWAALLLTVGYHESGFSLRIHAGGCRPGECDHGRSRGLFQQQANRHTREVWEQLVGVNHTREQTDIAGDQLERSYWTCARSGVPWVRATLSAYAGRRCSDEWPGLEARLATYRHLVRRFLVKS